MDPLHQRSRTPRLSRHRPAQIGFAATHSYGNRTENASPASTTRELVHRVPHPLHLMRLTILAVHGSGFACPTLTSTEPKPSSTALDLLPRRGQQTQYQQPRRSGRDRHPQRWRLDAAPT